MSKINSKSASPVTLSELLDRVALTDVERIRAEAECLLAEFIADLVIRGSNAVRSAVRSIKLSLKAKNPRSLGPTA